MWRSVKLWKGGKIWVERAWNDPEGRDHYEWNRNVMERFDERSKSTIQDVFIGFGIQIPDEMKGEAKEQLNHDLQVLQRSKTTLERLIISAENIALEDPTEVFELIKKFPNLKIFKSSTRAHSVAALVHSRTRERSLTKDQEADGASLRALWSGSAPRDFGAYDAIFNNVASLEIGERYSSLHWRRLLELPSQTLKHLKFYIFDHQETEPSDIKTINFPNLQLLEFGTNNAVFPYWFNVPPTLILVLKPRNEVPSRLPNIEEVRLDLQETNDFSNLGSQCPLLKELRFGEWLFFSRRDGILSLLRKRAENVEAGFELGGVKMIPLKKVVLSFRKTKLSRKVKTLVEEVVDLESVSETVPIHI